MTTAKDHGTSGQNLGRGATRSVAAGSGAPEASLRVGMRGRGGAVPGVVVWARRGCALVVAGVAAYASYIQQREFALLGGADATSATLWPLSVDGLFLLATVGLLTASSGGGRRGRVMAWLAFGLGIVVSLAANIAAAPSMAWRPVLVAGWPPVALLLAVELLAHRPAASGAQPSAPVGVPSLATTNGVPQPPGTLPRPRAGARRDGRVQAADALLERARQADARHRALHQRPISAEMLRKQLQIGAVRSRELVALVRAGNNGQPGVGPP